MATAPNQLTTPKLEENPALPLDTQANLVYTLTRLFRILAQIVNPLIAWADKWKYVAPVNESWGVGLEIKSNAPTTGNSTALRLLANETTGANYINGSRQIPENGKERTYWQMAMPEPVAQGDFTLTRFNPLTTAAGVGGTPYEVLRISRPSGNVFFANRVFSGNSTLIGGYTLNRPAGVESSINFQSSNVLRWYLAHATGDELSIARCDSNGAFLNVPFSINWGTGNISITTPTNMTNTLGVNGRITGGAVGDVAALYAPSGGIYTDWAQPYAFRATQGGIQVATTVQAGGRIISTANDGAAFFGQGGAGFYTERNAYDAIRAVSGGILVNQGFTCNGWQGVMVTGYNPGDGNYAYIETASGNPSWNLIHFRTWHQRGSWAGFQLYADGQASTMQFVMSAAGWGFINAGSFNVQSDERIKRLVEPLTQEHDAFMGIEPISWKWPEAPAPKKGQGANYDDKRTKWGFSAQNIATHVPLAVYGDVDAVDDKGQPVSASVDPIPITALTVLEVQALWKRLATLESRVAELEAA